MQKADVLSIIKNNAENNFDEYISSKDVCAAVCEKEGKLGIDYFKVAEEDLKDLVYHDAAFSQMLNRHEIPISFYRRCSMLLQEDIFGEHITEKSNDLLMRYSGPGKVRAVLSSGYGIMNDEDVFLPVLNELDEKSEILSFYYDHYMSQMTIRFPDAIAGYNGMKHSAGLVVSNSETGHSAIWVEPVVLMGNLHLVNRRALARQNVDCRLVHRGNLNIEKLLEMVRSMRDIAEVGVVQVCEAWEERMDAAKAIEFTERVEAFPKRFQKMLEDEWKDEVKIAKAEIARRIMELASQLPLFQRTQTEQSIGPMLGLFNDYRRRIDMIAAKIR